VFGRVFKQIREAGASLFHEERQIVSAALVFVVSRRFLCDCRLVCHVVILL
jgi:hypothetical protein